MASDLIQTQTQTLIPSSYEEVEMVSSLTKVTI